MKAPLAIASSLVVLLGACSPAPAPSTPEPTPSASGSTEPAGSSEPTPSSSPPALVGTGNCDLSSVTCKKLVQCPPGQTPTSDGQGCYGDCVPFAGCAPRTYACHSGNATCDMEEPKCGAGEVLTTMGSCYGPCVPSSICR